MPALAPLDRSCLRVGAIGLGAVLGTVGVVASRAPGVAAAFAALSLPTWLLVAGTLWRARALAAPGTTRLGAAMHLTALRGLLVSLLGGFLLVRPVGAVRWLPAALYTAAAVVDYFDGIVARRLGEATPLGAHFDEAMDALGLLVAPAVAVSWGRLPPWYLLLGAAYYLYRAGLWLRRRLALPLYLDRVTRRPLTRVFAGVQMALVSLALAPVLSLAVTSAAATVLMVPTLSFFVRDWLLLTGRRSSAPTATALR
jgi:CDP-diacylglycerol--glycerol-3-phosphate 3-phosphatidyltransferase